MDYYTPLEHRTMSFKEFIEEWIIKQFMDQFRDLGMKTPWYWETFLDELNWYHHGLHLGIWFWRPTVWWNPDAGVSPAERDWLETKYPGWNANFGKQWDVITKNVRKGAIPQTLPQTFPMICNLCQIPIITPSNPNGQHHLGPYPLDYNGRRYLFCSEPCKWVFEQNPSDLGGALAYMGNPQEVGGQDADNYAWAQEAPEPIAVG